MGSLPGVPRVGRIADNPDKDFADVFSMDGVSSSYVIRHLMGQAVSGTAVAVSVMPPGRTEHAQPVVLAQKAVRAAPKPDLPPPA